MHLSLSSEQSEARKRLNLVCQNFVEIVPLLSLSPSLCCCCSKIPTWRTCYIEKDSLLNSKLTSCLPHLHMYIHKLQACFPLNTVVHLVSAILRTCVSSTTWFSWPWLIVLLVGCISEEDATWLRANYLTWPFVIFMACSVVVYCTFPSSWSFVAPPLPPH